MWRQLYRYFMSLHYCWLLCPQSVAQGPENRQLGKKKKKPVSGTLFVMASAGHFRFFSNSHSYQAR